MKKLFTFLTLVLLMAAPRAVNATEVTTYAYDNSSVYYMKCVYDTDDGTAKIYLYDIDSYAYKKDMFFPNKVYVKFEDYDGKGGVLDVLDGGTEYELDENCSLDMIAYGDVVETLTIRCNGAIPDYFAYYMEMDSHTNPTSLRSITIGENITKIGNNAFPYHENLESITFSNSSESKLTEIGNNAFTAAREEEMMMPGSYTYYGNLKWLDLPESVTTIGAEAFAGHSALTSLIIPNTVYMIGNNAFANCGITDLTIGNGAGSMSSLTQSPFIGCPLKTVTVSADYSSEGYVASIAPYMFANVSSHFTLQFNPLYMTAYEFVGFYEKCLASSGVESILMPEGYSLSPMYPYAIFFDKSACEFTYNLSGIYIQTWEEIGNRVVVEDKGFYYSGLKDFKMRVCDGGMLCESTTPSTSLAKIGESAFEGSKLTGDLVLAKYINPATKAEDFLELGENAFANTPNLTSVTFEGKTNEGMYEWLPQGIFYRSGIKSVTLPANITAIGVNAFAESKLETFTADTNIEDIYQGAFKNCKELTSVDLSKSKVATLYQELFRNDSKLAELKLPEEMQYFQQYAFEGTALKSLNVNASHLDPYAIYDMPELEEVRFTHPLLMFVNENSLVSLPKLKTVDFGNYVKYLQ
ncbi:MAG: leucine-rich repeat domain-containing protein, partial [Paludibacteraceae bacterium]|nr:leucine-rich repeat domain-containing protein [Paludibacteraceae bacterium]